jgi:pimeloyl-ACP methyl ester carboxylesterase
MKSSAGSRTTLVLIHAFPFTCIMWEPQRAALCNVYDIYTPDLPGFGAEPRLDGEELSMAAAAEFIERELEARGIERCVLGGLSMGGYVAFECWRRFPERISGLILADTKASADTEEGRAARYASVDRIAAGDYEGYVEETLGNLVARQTRTVHPELMQAARAIALSVHPETAIAAQLGMAGRADATDLLSTISVPTALIFGEEDRVASLDEARRMEQAIPNAQLTIIPNAGHLSNIERAALFNGAVERLIEKVLCG